MGGPCFGDRPKSLCNYRPKRGGQQKPHAAAMLVPVRAGRKWIGRLPAEAANGAAGAAGNGVGGRVAGSFDTQTPVQAEYRVRRGGFVSRLPVASRGDGGVGLLIGDADVQP